jgi:FAD:protein FMN transferase
MKTTHILMDMPITVEVVDPRVSQADISQIFTFFRYVDTAFSPFKTTSEVSRINQKKLHWDSVSRDMRIIKALTDQTARETGGYFDANYQGKFDPSGVVKGWAIHQASLRLRSFGYKNFYVDAGGDVEAHGRNSFNQKWRVGIRNPFNRHEIIKVLSIDSEGVATSGTYIRGQHVYDPFHPGFPLREIVSLTVIGPDIYEADRFATAAFAMGRMGIEFIESLAGFEGFMIDATGLATATSGFTKYTHENELHR